GKRASLVREVAQWKASTGAPSFDRERESILLDSTIDKAREAGVSEQVVRDVFASLYAASRLDQRRFLQTKAEKFSIGIIGGTAGMGAFLARVFTSAGYVVEAMGLDAGRKAEEVAAEHDVVILS